MTLSAVRCHPAYPLRESGYIQTYSLGDWFLFIGIFIDRPEAPPNRAPVFAKPPPLIRDDAPIRTLFFVVPKSEATPSSCQATPQPRTLVSLYTNGPIRWVARELLRFLHHQGCRLHDRLT